MPGLTVHRPKNPDGAITSLTDALSQIPGRGDYRITAEELGAGLLVGSVSYPGYPLRRFSLDEYTVFLEGRVYSEDYDTVLELLSAIAASALSGARTSRKELSRIRTLDGEFVAVVVHRKSVGAVILNDGLARLPLYAYEGDRGVLVSREIAILPRYMDSLRFDRLGIGEFLTFGYPLGTRTFFSGVIRLPPATLAVIGTDGTMDSWSVPAFDFEEMVESRSRASSAQILVDEFREATGRRAGTENLLSLSGGLDSRSVAASLSGLGRQFQAASYLDAAGTATQDVRVAKEIIDRLGIDWKVVRLAPPRGEDLLELLRMKLGHNPLEMGFILEFYARFAADQGEGVVHFTGDGGDKTLPLLSPGTRMNDVEDIAGVLLERSSVTELKTAARLAGVTATDLRGSVVDRLAKYPEAEPAGKYAHFLVRERAINCNFEGEDRNRYYCWSTTPFYSQPFFNEAFACPPSQKAHFRLYREFLERLAPEMAAIERPGFGGAISDRKHTLLRRVQNLIYRSRYLYRLERWLRTGGSQRREDDLVAARVLERQLETSRAVREFLHARDFEEIPLPEGMIGARSARLLLSVTSAIEWLDTGESSLPGAIRPNEPPGNAQGTIAPNNSSKRK